MADDVRHRIKRLEDLFGTRADTGPLDDFLVIPNTTTVYATGSAVPLLGARPVETIRTQRSPLRLPGSDPAHFDYIGTYITLSEYYPYQDIVFPGLDLLQALADLEERLPMIRSLVAINELSKRPDGFKTIASQFSAGMAPEVRTRFDAALRSDTGGLGKLVVAPQPLLMSLRWLMGRPPVFEPAPNHGNPVTVFNRSILFCHALADTLESGETDGTEVDVAGWKRLMLAMMNLGTLGMNQDVYASVDRTVRLWRDYGGRAAERLSRSAHELFTDFAGVEVADVLAVGFALLAHIRGWEPDKPLLLDRAIHPDAPREIVESVLALIGQDFATAQQMSGDPISEFDYLSLETNPVLIEPGGLLVLDQDLLWRRCTSGLYWVVHDGLKRREGEAARHQWTLAYSEMVEALAEDSLRPLAPLILGSGQRSFYTEEDFEQAYGTIRRSDLGIDYGDSFLLIEVVSGQLTVLTRVRRDLKKLEEDFDRLVLDKCLQLDSTARLLLNDEEPLTGVPRGSRHPRIIPALVVGGGFPLNHLSYSYIRMRLGELELLDHPLISPLAVLDLEDVEVLEGLGEQGLTPSALLEQWQASELRDLSIHNYLLRVGVLSKGARPARMGRTVDATFDDVVRRLRLTAN